MWIWHNLRGLLSFLITLPTVIGALIMGCGASGSDDDRVRVRVGGEELYLAPAGASEARVRAILPTKGSEDVSNSLGSIASDAERSLDEGVRDYLPEMATDWVIDVQFEGDPRLDPHRISDRFSPAWHERHGPMTIYALNPDTGHWTFLISADGPAQVTRLKMAWAYLDPNGEDPETPSPQVFSDREAAVRKAIGPLGAAALKVSLPPDEAADRARRLREIKSRLNYSPTLVLRAPKGGRFEGREVWDVMQCLGLKWGDMDVFHWINPGRVGDDSFFSVWTSTPPGYFLPEEIAAGKVRVGDLVFGFSAPRCSQPGQVFESMVRALQYTQNRLGGAIVDDSGSVADIEGIRRKIRSVEQEMKANGFTPGGDGALHLF
jgi:cell division protein ZipA